MVNSSRNQNSLVYVCVMECNEILFWLRLQLKCPLHKLLWTHVCAHKYAHTHARMHTHTRVPTHILSFTKKSMLIVSVLATWRGHIESVTSVTLVEAQKMILTSSLDCTVRLWTLEGHYVGMSTILLMTQVFLHQLSVCQH